MGIYDRHYVRDQPRRPGGFGPGRGGGGIGSKMRMWSANTWLIVACVGIFVIDGFLPPRLVEMRTEWLIDNPSTVDKSALVPVGDPKIGLWDPQTKQPVIVTQEYGLPVLGGKPIARQTRQRMRFLESYLHFSTQRGFLQVEFWRLIGFQFAHANFTHLLFNMIGLYFFGGLVERYLGSKRYLAFYLLCGICGALMYVLLNLGGQAALTFFGLKTPIPGLLFNDLYTPLIGASAGVFGILMAGAFLAPNATVLVFFILPMRLRTMAYVLVGIALITILTGGTNAGGEAGHLGGALAGFYFIRHPHHLHGFFDILGRIDPTSHHYSDQAASARARLKLQRSAAAPGGGRAGAPGRTGAGSAAAGGGPDAAEIDRILDKVHRSGLRSLSDNEKRILAKASERQG